MGKLFKLGFWVYICPILLLFVALEALRESVEKEF